MVNKTHSNKQVSTLELYYLSIRCNAQYNVKYSQKSQEKDQISKGTISTYSVGVEETFISNLSQTSKQYSQLVSKTVRKPSAFLRKIFRTYVFAVKREIVFKYDTEREQTLKTFQAK